jgi:hypothetical protein
MKHILNRLKKSDALFFKTVRNKKSFIYKMKQEASLWAAILKFLDIPSGSIVGMFTLQIWIMMWIAFFTHHDLSSGILTAYGSVLAGFTVHGIGKMATNKGEENE